jgi:dihydrofolate reductase
MMYLSAIVAMAENRVIGKNNQLPWRLPADLRHFKEITLGKPLLMGRKTYESIGRLLPGRQNVIITRNQNFQVLGADIVHSLEQAWALLADANEVMVIGGAELFCELLPQIQRIYLTLVHAAIEGDSYFPALNPAEWCPGVSEEHRADEENNYGYSFVTWERATAPLKKPLL